MVIGDAHAYLLEHFGEYDFIWSSPPCPTHSEIRRCGVYRGQYKAKYPDMKLYEEIIMLKYFHKKESKYIIENVRSYYKPLIPCQEVANHYLWANFKIGNFNTSSRNIENTKVSWEKHGFNVKDKDCGQRKDRIIRNIFNPHLGLHILNESKRDIQPELFR